MLQYSLMSLEAPKQRMVVWSSAIALFVVVGVWPLAIRCWSLLPASAPAGTHGPYTTNFSGAENPISEGGRWLNGQTDGLDWTDVRTTPASHLGPK